MQDWMSLDEYLDLCEAAGLTPLIGVNYNCHGENWVPEDESVDRAVRQAEHVVGRGFVGALWYIGNEDGAQGGNSIDFILTLKPALKLPREQTSFQLKNVFLNCAPQNHADSIAKHARAMKEVDPTMLIFWNDNDQSPSRLKDFLSTAGDAVDGAEFHGKWPFGGNPGLDPGTYDEWIRGAIQYIFNDIKFRYLICALILT